MVLFSVREGKGYSDVQSKAMEEPVSGCAKTKQ
jgi:hypothetical protein